MERMIADAATLPKEGGLLGIRSRSGWARILALALLLSSTAAALAGCIVVPGYATPGPVYVAPAPVYVAPAPVYVWGGRSWHRGYRR